MLISCLMVTQDRPGLARRAIECLRRQTYRPVELVVVDSGETPLQLGSEDFEVRHEHLPRSPDRFLGWYRNRSMELARGELMAQWDDDDWYHPRRLELQARALGSCEAVFLRRSLVHLDDPEFFEHPFRTDSIDGVAGSVLYRRGSVRYPNQPRSEDKVFQQRLSRTTLIPESHLFIRCFHGTNTWSRAHFLGKLRRGVVGEWHTAWARLRGSLLRHPWFRLTEIEARAFAEYREMSLQLGCFAAREPRGSSEPARPA